MQGEEVDIPLAVQEVIRKQSKGFLKSCLIS